MDSILHLSRTILYPFWHFCALAIVFESTKYLTMYFVLGGRLKAFHSVKNYWIYLLVTICCLLTGVIFGYGNLIVFYRWFICAQLVGLLGIHFGYDKALGLTDEDLEDMEDEVDEQINRMR